MILLNGAFGFDEGIPFTQLFGDSGCQFQYGAFVFAGIHWNEMLLSALSSTSPGNGQSFSTSIAYPILGQSLPIQYVFLAQENTGIGNSTTPLAMQLHEPECFLSREQITSIPCQMRKHALSQFMQHGSGLT